MPRASTLMLNAVTTMSALLNDEAPRGTRAVTEAVSSLSAVAWRWHQVPARPTPAGRRRGRRAAHRRSPWAVVVAGASSAPRAAGWPSSPGSCSSSAPLLAAGRYALFSLKRRGPPTAARTDPPPTGEDPGMTTTVPTPGSDAPDSLRRRRRRRPARRAVRRGRRPLPRGHRGRRPTMTASATSCGEPRPPRRAPSTAASSRPGSSRTGCPRWRRATLLGSAPRPAARRRQRCGPGATPVTRCGCQVGPGRRRRRVGGLPPPDRAGRPGRRQRSDLDELVLRRRAAARAAAQVVPDPQARPHARDALREQPGAPLPRRASRPGTSRATSSRPSGPGGGAAPTAPGTTCSRTPTAATTRWSGRRTPASSATSATTAGWPGSSRRRTRRPTR